MKKLYRAVCILLLLSIISTAVILILSPDVIPAHYNAAGEVDRFGSKYEHLIFPGFAFLMAGIMLSLLHLQRKRGMPEPEQKILLYTTVFSLVLFNGLGVFFGIIAINYSGDPVALKPDTLIRFISIVTGVLLMFFGNIMPKARRNAIFGLRTKWSMANDQVWRKSQRFGGISAVICGVLMVLSAAILPGDWNMAAMTLLILAWIAACVSASYVYYKKMPV